MSALEADRQRLRQLEPEELKPALIELLERAARVLAERPGEAQEICALVAQFAGRAKLAVEGRGLHARLTGAREPIKRAPSIGGDAPISSIKLASLLAAKKRVA